MIIYSYYKCIIICLYLFSDENRPFLIVANRNQILNMSFSGSYQKIIVSDTENAVAVDYDFRSKTIYWTDITSKNSWIRRLDLSSDDNEVGIYSMVHILSVLKLKVFS